MGQHLPYPFTHQCARLQPSHGFKRRVDLNKAVVHRGALVIAQDVVHGKAAAHLVEQGAGIKQALRQLLALGHQRVQHCIELAGNIAHLGDVTHSIKRNALLQIAILHGLRHSGSNLDRPHRIAPHQPQHQNSKEHCDGKQGIDLVAGLRQFGVHFRHGDACRNDPARAVHGHHRVQTADTVGLRGRLKEPLSLLEGLGRLWIASAVGANPLLGVPGACQHHPVVIKQGADGVFGESIECALVDRIEVHEINPCGDIATHGAAVIAQRLADGKHPAPRDKAFLRTRHLKPGRTGGHGTQRSLERGAVRRCAQRAANQLTVQCRSRERGKAGVRLLKVAKNRIAAGATERAHTGTCRQRGEELLCIAEVALQRVGVNLRQAHGG